MQDWLPYRDRYLDELLRHEGKNGISDPPCSRCQVGAGDFKCQDCFGNTLHCQQCILDCHRNLPLHRLLVSNTSTMSCFCIHAYCRNGQAHFSTIFRLSALASKYTWVTRVNPVRTLGLKTRLLPSSTPAAFIPFISYFAAVSVQTHSIHVYSFFEPAGFRHQSIVQKLHSHLTYSTLFTSSRFKARYPHTTSIIH